MNFGMKVTIKLANGNQLVLRNVTEIHWNFPSFPGSYPRCAFESDVQTSGTLIDCNQIREFETELESKKMPTFDER